METLVLQMVVAALVALSKARQWGIHVHLVITSQSQLQALRVQVGPSDI